MEIHCSADMCHLMYRAKLGSVIVHLFFISVRSIECILKIFIAIKATEDCCFCFLYFWHLTVLTFPTERFWVTGLEVLSCLRITRLIPDASQLCLCYFQMIKFGPFWGKKKKGVVICHTPRGLTTRHALIYWRLTASYSWIRRS